MWIREEAPMRRFFRNTPFILAVLLLATLAACAPTGDSIQDAESATRLLPNIAGYSAQDASSVSSVVASLGGGAAAVTGNVEITALLAQVDYTLQCLRTTGSIAAAVYTQEIPSGLVPSAGVVAVINQDRVASNLLACIVPQADPNQARALSASLQPCAGSGSLRFLGDTFTYVYVWTTPEMCAITEQHFQNVAQNNG
jgi:hypothetical protein